VSRDVATNSQVWLVVWCLIINIGSFQLIERWSNKKQCPQNYISNDILHLAKVREFLIQTFSNSFSSTHAPPIRTDIRRCSDKRTSLLHKGDIDTTLDQKIGVSFDTFFLHAYNSVFISPIQIHIKILDILKIINPHWHAITHVDGNADGLAATQVARLQLVTSPIILMCSFLKRFENSIFIGRSLLADRVQHTISNRQGDFAGFDDLFATQIHAVDVPARYVTIQDNTHISILNAWAAVCFRFGYKAKSDLLRFVNHQCEGL
jgi:hypothetical protein